MKRWEYHFAGGTVVWEPLDTVSEALLANLAEFCPLQESTLPGSLHVAAVPEEVLLAQSKRPEAWTSYCSVITGKTIWLDHDFERYRQPEIHFARLRQIFYAGLWPFFAGGCVPVHGALLDGGILLFGQSGMGKTTACSRLAAAGWSVEADDAFLLWRQDGVFQAEALPTWSCGYLDKERWFHMCNKATPVKALVELRRGKTCLTRVIGSERYASLLPAMNDLLPTYTAGRDKRDVNALRRSFFAGSEQLLRQACSWRLQVNLEDDFTDLVKEINEWTR